MNNPPPNVSALLARILASRQPADVFTLPNYRPQYLQFLKLLHPDVCALPGANDAVTRAYHTRHGAGPLPGEAPLALRHHEHETNRPHPYQGCFRLAPLHLPSVRHALAADAPHAVGHARHLLITCLDQTPAEQVLCSDGEVSDSAAPGQVPALLGVAFDSLHLAYGPTATTVRSA